MATISITVPDAIVNDLADALGFNPDEGITRAVFARRWVASRWKAALIAYRDQQNQQAGHATAVTEAEGIS